MLAIKSCKGGWETELTDCSSSRKALEKECSRYDTWLGRNLHLEILFSFCEFVGCLDNN